MALPAVPAIVAFFASLLGSLVGFFARWFTKKTAIQLGVVAAIAALTITLFGAIKLSIAGISLVTPTEVRQGLDMVLPSNFEACASTLISARIIRWVWVWKVHFIEMYAN